MDKERLKLELLQSLQKMYDMERIAPLLEFCQGEMRVLLYLDSHKADLSEIHPSDLSQALFVTRQRITTILATLRKKGYVVTEASRSDGRRMRVTISEAGLDYVREKRALADAYFEFLIESLGERDAAEFNRLIKRTVEKLEEFAK